MSEKDNKSRPRLGKKAIALVSQYVPEGEPITGAHLELAIGELERRAEEEKSISCGVDEDKLRNEFDLLHTDLAKEIEGLKEELEPQLKSIAASLDTIRIMLNIFGEELGGADTSDLFREAHNVMEKVLQPLASDARERNDTAAKAPSDEHERGSQTKPEQDHEDAIITHEDPDLEVNGHSVMQEQNSQGLEQAPDQERGR